jgi:hypothetical protein
VLSTIGENANDAENRRAEHLSGTANAQGEAVEIEVDHVEIGERPFAPRLETVLQRDDHTRYRALRECRSLEERLERATYPSGVASRQVRRDDRFVDLGACAADNAERSSTSIPLLLRTAWRAAA